MSLKYNVVLVWVICLSFKVVMTGCEVVLVNRNVTDSFRVGEDGCTNDKLVCWNFDTTCQSDGLCLCPVSHPNFRKPTGIKAYGCLRSDSIRAGAGGTFSCAFGPFQLIPYSQQDPATKFSDDNPKVVMKSCFLTKALAKFPDNATEMELQWLNESYVDLTIANRTLHFKWKRSVPALQGTIITLGLFCILGSQSSATKCLRAKVLGTWSADAVFVPTEPTLTSTKPRSSQITTNATSPVTVTTVTTAEPKSTASTSSDEDCSNSNVSNKVFIALFSISLVVNIVLGIIVGFLWRNRKRMQDKNLKIREMKNIDEQRRANSANEINTYDEVVTDSGIHNEGIYDESFPSSRHNNNERMSGHKYEEPSNYEPLRRNPLQDQSDEHNYQSLTTS